jgi:hypothetical protein
LRPKLLLAVVVDLDLGLCCEVKRSFAGGVKELNLIVCLYLCVCGNMSETLPAVSVVV